MSKQPPPIVKSKDKILSVLHETDILVLVAETGSGKSIFLPMLINEKYPNHKIYITEPRQLNCKNIAKTVNSLFQKKGIVGYKYQFESTETDKTKILYLTDGIMSNIIDDLLDRDDVIIMIDEVHEHSINIDYILYKIKKAKKIPKVIIMSATIDPKKYTSYFPHKSEVISVEGRSFPVSSVFHPIKNGIRLIDGITDLLGTILDKEQGNILIFLPTKKEINQLVDMINKKYKASKSVIALPLHSKMSFESERLATHASLYKSRYRVDRKVIVSTDVAESGVTIEGIRVVIESGLKNKMIFHSRTRVYNLKVDFTARMNIIQRKGRAGRLSEGVCYHLYSEETFDNIPFYSDHSIKIEPIDDIVFKFMKEWNGNRKRVMKSFSEFIDPPSNESVESTINYIEKYDVMKYLDKINQIRLPLELSLLLVHSDDNLHFMIPIISMFYVTDRFEDIFNDKKFVMKNFKTRYGELFAYYKLYKKFKRNKQSIDKFEITNKINRGFFVKVLKVKSRLKKAFGIEKLKIYSKESEVYRKFRDALLRVYPMNVGTRVSKGSKKYAINLYDYLHNVIRTETPITVDISKSMFSRIYSSSIVFIRFIVVDSVNILSGLIKNVVQGERSTGVIKI